MSWLDLHEGILDEFAERAAPTFDLASAIAAGLNVDAYASRARRRAEARQAAAAARAPCPGCGASVERAGAVGMLATWCSRRCYDRKRAAGTGELRAQVSAAKMAGRRCAFCEEPVTRTAARGPLPKFCSKVCCDAASHRARHRARKAAA